MTDFKVSGLKRDPPTNGPSEHRKMTNKLWLVIYIVLASFAISKVTSHIRNGNYDRIGRLFDSSENVCGMPSNENKALEAHKYLYFDLPAKNESFLARTACVSACPKDSAQQLDCYDQTGVNCSRFTVYSTVPVLGRVCVPIDQEFYKKFSSEFVGVNLNSHVENIFSNLSLIGLSLLAALVLALAYSRFMKSCAGMVVLASILSAFTGLACLGYLAFQKYSKLTTDSIGAPDSKEILEAARFYKIGAYMVWAVALVFLLIVAFLFERIMASVKVVKAAGSFVSSVKSIMFVPLIPAVFISFLLVLSGSAALSIYSQGSVNTSSKTHMGKFDLQPEQK
jgi:hypothetical protein